MHSDRSSVRPALGNGGITTTVKHAIKLTIKLKTSPCPARLAQHVTVAALISSLL